MEPHQKPPAQTSRIYWMDNLRTVIILLVALYHVGGVYEAAGLWGWFWIVDDPSTITWVGIVGVVFDIFVMPTVFFLSGYLAPVSLDARTERAFALAKFKRLIIPWVLAIVTLIPLYKVIFLFSRGLPQEHWTTYSHITNPNSQNWLWFLPVLFVFNMLYLLISKTGLDLTKVSIKWSVVAVFVIGLVTSYGLGSVLGFRSWTLTPLLDFENERVLLYLMAFWLGAVCYKQDVFAGEPKGKLLYIVANSVAWIPITVHIFTRLVPFFYPEGFAVTPLYRLIWWVGFHSGAICMVYLMVESFRRYLDKTSRLWRELSRNSYGVYIIHVIVIGVFGTLLLPLGLPAVAKYLLLVILTILGSNLIVSGYRALARTMRTRRP